MDFFRQLFHSGDFQPHGFCYQWNSGLVWLNVLSDTLIALAYFTIPFTLLWFIRKRRDLPFSWMFGLFGVFIVACGTTHVMEVWNLWHAQYWLAGGVKAITAVASLFTAVLLIQLVPKTLALPSANEFKAINQHLIDRTKEVALANAGLARSNAGLVEANKELESFSYSVSHDLRAPLRTIDGFSHALLEDCAGTLDDAGKTHLNRIRAATQRMGLLIDDLLNLSQLSRAEMHRQVLDISALAAAVASELQKAQPQRQIELRIESGLQTTADPGLLRVVMENLLSNAWKFTSKHKAACIEFGMTRNNGTPAFFVRDDGAGFNPAYADRLFGAFQRLHSMEEFAGTGVGLATVQRIVQRHGGTIWAESAVDRGATFYFTMGEAAT